MASGSTDQSLESRDAAAVLAAAAADPGRVVLEGLHAVKHALRFGAHVEAAYARDRDDVLALAGELAADVVPALASLLVEVGDDVALGGSGRRVPTGVTAVALRPAAAIDDAVGRHDAPLVLLDDPRALANVGAVVRAAAAADAAGVLTRGALDPWDPAALRGSAGLHFALPVGRVADAEPAIGDRPSIGFDAAGTRFDPTVLPPNATLAFGSERSGLSPELRSSCDELVALPMRAGVSSLNLATTVAAVLMSWRLATGWSGATADS